MSNHSSESGGVPIFSIGGRMVRERERLCGMTDEERRWRAQFLKDQILDADEPRFSPEYYRATTNVFRRMFRFPMQLLQNALTPMVGQKRARDIRFVTGRLGLMLIVMYCGTYYFSYNRQNWTSENGWDLKFMNPPLLPGDPGYPNVPTLKNHEYYDLGFSKTHFFKE